MREEQLTKKLQKLLSWVGGKLFRALEELLPAVYFYYISNKCSKKLYEFAYPEIEDYSKLPDEKIEERLKSEHERAQKIDEKTSKFTLGLSISLSIISGTASGVVKFLPKNQLNDFIVLLFGVSSLYMLSGGLLALGALKTLPKFGYGTYFEINKNTATLARSLIGQEKVNTLRHIRNELSFMSLRNGFLLVLTALFLCVIVLFNQTSFYESTRNVGQKVCYFCSTFI